METRVTVAIAVVAAAAAVAGYKLFFVRHTHTAPKYSARDVRAIETVNHHLELQAREHPSCDDVSAAIEERLTKQLGYLGAPIHCQLMTVPTKKGPRPALAITIGDGSSGHPPMRGVTSADGTIDLVSFSETPDGAPLSAVADLDGDGADELVFVSEQRAFVTRIDDFTFDDLEVPPPGDCGMKVDVRNARRRPGKVLMRTLYGNCSGLGYITYEIRDGELVEGD